MQSAKSLLAFVQKIIFVDTIMQLYKDSFLTYFGECWQEWYWSIIMKFMRAFFFNNGISFAILTCLEKFL